MKRGNFDGINGMDGITEFFMKESGNGVARTRAFPSATWERGKRNYEGGKWQRGRGKQDQITKFSQINEIFGGEESNGIAPTIAFPNGVWERGDFL
jgi:hypothetical protein